MHNEEWRPTHHPNYDVSSLGRVRSRVPVGRPSQSGKMRNRFRVVKGTIRQDGYIAVDFAPAHTKHMVHLLVLRAFVGPCPSGQEAMHKDDNRANARLDNLEYGTHLQNMHDCLRRGRQKWRKLTWKQVEEIRESLDTLAKLTGRLPVGSSKKVAAIFGVSARCIEAVFHRESWTLGF